MENFMKKNYNFLNSKKNPYIKKLKKPITIRLDMETIEYFKSMTKETGIPYQNLINMYLSDCAIHQKKPSLVWK